MNIYKNFLWVRIVILFIVLLLDRYGVEISICLLLFEVRCVFSIVCVYKYLGEGKVESRI